MPDPLSPRILAALAQPMTTDALHTRLGILTRTARESIQRLHATRQIHIHAWDTSTGQPRAIWIAGAGVDAVRPRRVWVTEKEAVCSP